jgi:hypothetical protein
MFIPLPMNAHVLSWICKHLGRIRIPVVEQHVNVDLKMSTSIAENFLKVRPTCMLIGQKWLEVWSKWLCYSWRYVSQMSIIDIQQKVVIITKNWIHSRLSAILFLIQPGVTWPFAWWFLLFKTRYRVGFNNRFSNTLCWLSTQHKQC